MQSVRSRVFADLCRRGLAYGRRVHVSAEIRDYRTSVLLATASVLVQDYNGQFRSVRALLDSASQSSFITEHCFKGLGLSRLKRGLTSLDVQLDGRGEDGGGGGSVRVLDAMCVVRVGC
ncbi:hypothetical protein ACI65C_003723 [Semiaphis heraclei]